MAQDLSERIKGWKEPLYGQGSIRGLTSSEKRKLRWQHAGDAAKGSLASIYNAVTGIPSTIAKIPAAGIDQLAGTDIQGAIDKTVSKPYQALKDSAGSSYHFNKGEEVTDAGLTAAALLTAGATGPKGPKVKLNDLAKNPSKYSNAEAMQIIKDSIAAKPTTTEKVMQSIGDTTSKTLQKIGDTKLGKYLQEKEVQNANNKLAKELGYKNAADMEKQIAAEYAEGAKGMGPEADAVERGLYEFGDAERAMYRNQNTSKARAAATKAKNMRSSKKSAAEERAKDSKNELDAAAAVKDAKNMSLEDMFKLWKSQQNG